MRFIEGKTTRDLMDAIDRKNGFTLEQIDNLLKTGKYAKVDGGYLIFDDFMEWLNWAAKNGK